MTSPKSLYEILNLPEDTNETELKRQYRIALKSLHPDTGNQNPQAQQKFMELLVCEKPWEQTSTKQSIVTQKHTHVSGPKNIELPQDERMTIEIDLVEALLGTSIPIDHEHYIDIPREVEHGTRLRIQNHLLPKNFRTPGDFFIEILVRPHSFLKREKQNLELWVPVSFTTFLFGGQVTLFTLEGLEEFHIPQGTHGRQSFCLSGRGLRHPTSKSRRGDLWIRPFVDVPNLVEESETMCRLHLNEIPESAEAQAYRTWIQELR